MTPEFVYIYIYIYILVFGLIVNEFEFSGKKKSYFIVMVIMLVN